MIEDARKFLIGPPLRSRDLVFFLRDSGRSEVCPFCEYKGGWDMHVELGEDESSANPQLTVYQIPSSTEPDNPHTCVAVTCPRCGHFSMISEYRVRIHRSAKEAAISD